MAYIFLIRKGNGHTVKYGIKKRFAGKTLMMTFIFKYFWSQFFKCKETSIFVGTEQISIDSHQSLV